MKTKVIYFLFGFVVSWLTFSIRLHENSRPRDLTTAASWTPADREIATWEKSAHGRKCGKFDVFTPADFRRASALIHPPVPDHFPQVALSDPDADGKLNSVLVFDSLHRWFSIEDQDSDGVFDGYTFSTGYGEDSVSFRDYDLDGKYDLRLGQAALSVTIGGQWYELVADPNGGPSVKMNGELRRVEGVIGGEWKLLNEI